MDHSGVLSLPAVCPHLGLDTTRPYADNKFSMSTAERSIHIFRADGLR